MSPRDGEQFAELLQQAHHADLQEARRVLKQKKKAGRKVRRRALWFIGLSGALLMAGVAVALQLGEWAARVGARGGSGPLLLWLVMALGLACSLAFPFLGSLQLFLLSVRAKLAVDGRIISAALEKRRGKRVWLYNVVVQVTYQAMGRTFETVLTPSSWTHNVMFLHKRTLARYAPGTKVVLHCDPDSPGLPFLTRFSIGNILGLFLLGVLYYAACCLPGLLLGLLLAR